MQVFASVQEYPKERTSLFLSRIRIQVSLGLCQFSESPFSLKSWGANAFAVFRSLSEKR